MTARVNATELEIIREFEGWTLARYQGNLGIWSIHKAIGKDIDDDCNNLLDPEFYGVFGCRVSDGHLFEIKVWEQPDDHRI